MMELGLEAATESVEPLSTDLYPQPLLVGSPPCVPDQLHVHL